jgi:hypothetical protein
MTVRFVGIAISALLLSAGAVCAQERQPEAISADSGCDAACQASAAEEERARDAELVRKREEEERAVRLREMERQAAEAQAARERADATRVQRLWVNPDIGPMPPPRPRAPEPPAVTTPTASMLVDVCLADNDSRWTKDVLRGRLRSPSNSGHNVDYLFDSIVVRNCSDGRYALYVRPIIDYNWQHFPVCKEMLSAIVDRAKRLVPISSIEQAAIRSYPPAKITEMIPLELVCDRMYERKQGIVLFSNIP